MLIWLVLVWLVLVVVTFFSRTFFPLDETRYVSVAWEMWLRGDFLVPHLNGLPYSHKPPLLFWLMQAGWAVFGVNDWWPRLIPALFSISALFMTHYLARLLWPKLPQVALLAPVILLGCGLWTVFSTAIMFDMMMAFFTLLGMIGLVHAWHHRTKLGWGLVTIAIGAGMLAKGPAILLYVLPTAVLAPWWMQEQRPRWKTWYLQLLGATLLGCALLLAWAIPAAWSGGAQYQHDIFWGQTANRMVKSFAHQHPVWWYLEILPLILFPWLFALPVWRAWKPLKRQWHQSGLRFCLAWALPVFVAFSLISGKQPHYLLPIFPAFALFAARGLADVHRIRHGDKAMLMLLGVLVGAAMVGLAAYGQTHPFAQWANQLSWQPGAALVLASLVLFAYRNRSTHAFVWRTTLLSSLTVSALFIGIIHVAGHAYDLRPMSHEIHALQTQQIPVAYMGKYHGQFNFIGRLTEAPTVLEVPTANVWFEAHPNGQLIMSFGRHQPLYGLTLRVLMPYRGGQIGLLTYSDWKIWLKAANQAASLPASDANDEAE